MQRIFVMGLAGAVLCGCATQRQVSSMEGRGTRAVYAHPFNNVWRAAVDAGQVGELEILSADKTRGYIATHRGHQFETFGENVAIWVKPVSPTETQVEVVSRQAGPPKFWLRNWETEIHRAIAANLTRDTALMGTTTGTATGAAAPVVGTVTGTGSSLSERERMRRETERQLDALRAAERRQAQELEREANELRRQELRGEIERLRSQLRSLEQRLSEVESDVR